MAALASRYLILFALFFINIGVLRAQELDSLDSNECLNETRLQILQLQLPGNDRAQNKCQRRTEVAFHCIAGVTSIPKSSLQMALPSHGQLRMASIGEGYSGMVEQLRANQVAAVGIDFDEGYRTKTDALLAAHPDFYFWGDATELSSHLFVREGALDLVVSHCMLCSMPHQMAQTSLIEAAKSIAVGGEARFSYFPHKSMAHDTAFLGTLLKGVAVELSLQNLNIEINVAQVKLYFGQSPQPRIMRMIRLKRYVSGGAMPLRQEQCAGGAALGDGPLMQVEAPASEGEACSAKVAGSI